MSATQHKPQLLWVPVLMLIYIHVSGLYGVYLFFFEAKWATLPYWVLLMMLSSQGTGAGVHRLWAHRAYKKNIYNWVRDHRVHHKYSDTVHDPHNSSRGFFYSHMGWLMYKKPIEVTSKGKLLDLSDLEADPVVMFQKKYYWILAPIIGLMIPAFAPWYFWNETLNISWHVGTMLRYMASFNITCLVNSVAHLYGNKPFDKNIKPVQSFWVSLLSQGEGFHNYHHTFPWDYKASELDNYNGNFSTAFIDFMAMIGWAYDLRTVSKDMVETRAKKTGDGTWNTELYGTERTISQQVLR